MLYCLPYFCYCFECVVYLQVTGHLFENEEGERKAFDLISLNLQRARDHGVAGYNAYRALLGLGKVRGFDDPALGEAGPSLALVYRSVQWIKKIGINITRPI